MPKNSITKPSGIIHGDQASIAYIKNCSPATVTRVLNGERSDCKGILDELQKLIQYRESRRAANQKG